MIKSKNLQPRLLYPTRLFKIKGQIKCFPDKTNTNKQTIPVGVLHHQISITKNVNKTSLRRRNNEKKNINIKNKITITIYLK